MMSSQSRLKRLGAVVRSVPLNSVGTEEYMHESRH